MRVFAIIAAGLVASATAVPSSSDAGSDGTMVYQSGLPPGMTSSEASALVAAGNLPYTVGANGVRTYTLPNPAMQNQQKNTPAAASDSSKSSSSSASNPQPKASTSSSV